MLGQEPTKEQLVPVEEKEGCLPPTGGIHTEAAGWLSWGDKSIRTGHVAGPNEFYAALITHPRLQLFCGTDPNSILDL